MNLPVDNYILLSYVNTLLRNSGLNLSELCEREDFSETQIRSKLASLGYEYSEPQNAFLQK